MDLEDIPEELETLEREGFVEDTENVVGHDFDYGLMPFRPSIWETVNEYFDETDMNYIQVSDVKESKNIGATRREIGKFLDQLESEEVLDTWGKRYSTELKAGEQAIEDAATYSFYLNCKDALRNMDETNSPMNAISRLEGVEDAYWNELKFEEGQGLFYHTKSDFPAASSTNALIDYAVKANLIKTRSRDSYPIRSNVKEVELAETAFENY